MINSKKRGIAQLPTQPRTETRPRKISKTNQGPKKEAANSGSKKKNASEETEENLWPAKPPILAKENKNPTYKTVPCKNFSNTGYCSYGPVCQFMHGLMDYKGGVSEKAIPERAKGSLKTIPCQRFSLLGTCAEGSSCQFMHGSMKSKPSQEMGRQGPPKLYKTAPCRHFAMTGYCSFGVTCRFLHGRERSTNQNYKTAPCQNWINSGSCSYGDVCQFLHGQGDPAVDVGAQRIMGNNGAAGGPPFISTMTPMQSSPTNTYFNTLPCSNWTQTGICTYGDACQYAHDEDVQQQNWAYQRSSNVPLGLHPRSFNTQQSFIPPMGMGNASRKPNYKTVLCRHFARNGRCLMGNMCDFRHDEGGTANVKSSGFRSQPGVSSNYKTVPCRNWSNTGKCSYEKVCQFKHGED